MDLSKPDAPRFQFTLGDLFWLTTVVSVLCASAAYFGHDICVPIVAFFWPTIAAVIVLTWPCRSWPARLRFVTLIWRFAIGVAAALPFLIGLTATIKAPERIDGFPIVTVIAFILEAFIGVLIWLPQGLIFFAILTYFKERSRESNEVEASAVTHAIRKGESHDERLTKESNLVKRLQP